MEPIDARLKQVTEDFVLTVELTEREIDLMYERDPKAAAAAMRQLCAVVDDTGREIGRILNRGKEGE